MTEMVRVRTVFTGFSGAPGLMTNYFRPVAATINQSLADLAKNRIKDAFTAHHEWLPVAFRWTTQAQVDVLEDTTGEVVDSLVVSPDTGTGTSSQTGFAPIASGALIKWGTGAFVGGHRVVGKTYMVPIGNNNQDLDGSLSVGAAAGLNGWATSMLDSGASDCKLVIWSRPRAERAAGPGGKPTHLAAREGSSHVATSGVVNDKLAVLTSRRD